MLRLMRQFSLPLILLIAAFLRFWQINQVPPGFHFDEAYEGLEAWHILVDRTYRPLFLSGNFGVPVLNAYANALMFGLFRLWGGDAGPTAMRVTAACFGVLGVGALYALAVELRKVEKLKPSLSPLFPCFAVAILATMRWHIHFSRMGIEPVLVPLIWTLVFWFWLRGWRTGHWLNFVGCGVMLAASIYAYQSAWIIPFLLAPIGLIFISYDLGWTKQTRANRLPSAGHLSHQRLIGLLVTALVAFILFAPFGWYAWHHLDLVLLRPTQVAATGGTDVQRSLWRNSTDTLLMYSPLGAVGDPDVRRNLPSEPVLNWWEALSFYVGVGLALWRIRRPSYALLLISWVGLLLPGALSQFAPHFHRLLGASAPTALLGAVALDGLWQWGRQLSDNLRLPDPQTRWSFATRQIQWISVLLLLLGSATSAYGYFVRWAHLPGLYYAFDVGLWQIGQEIASIPAAQPVYLTPTTIDHPTLAFALRNQARPQPITFDGRHIFPLTAQINAQPEFYVVIEHEDFRTRFLLSKVLPTAFVQQELFDRQGQVYARVYQRPPDTLPQGKPQHERSQPVGDGIQLLGYDVYPKKLKPGKSLYLQLHWLVNAPPKANWTVFNHVSVQAADSQFRLVAGHDSLPGANTLPTNDWQAGWRVLDEYEIALPSDLAAGEYVLETGLYQANGEHLPAQAAGIRLGKIKIK